MIDLDKADELCRAATPGPWEWRDAKNRARSDIVYYEPYTDGSSGKGSRYDLITRDSGVYGPDVLTCEFIVAARTMLPEAVAELRLLRRVAEAADKVCESRAFEDYGGVVDILRYRLVAYDAWAKGERA